MTTLFTALLLSACLFLAPASGAPNPWYQGGALTIVLLANAPQQLRSPQCSAVVTLACTSTTGTPPNVLTGRRVMKQLLLRELETLARSLQGSNSKYLWQMAE